MRSLRNENKRESKNINNENGEILNFEDNSKYFYWGAGFIEILSRSNAPESDLSINVIIMYTKMRYQSINR